MRKINNQIESENNQTMNTNQNKNKMKQFITSLLLTVLVSFPAITQMTDVDGCKDSPMFPTRMPHYFISECKSDYDAADFNTAAGGETKVTKEGTHTQMQYNFDTEAGVQKPSVLQILRNYETAAKNIGAVTVFLSAPENLAVFKIMKNGQESAWVKIETIGSDGTDSYILTIIQLAEMKQEITADDMLKTLNADGHIALYINFETGKADIKPESQVIIDQIVEMMKANPTLKVSIEGHTDNVGTATANQTLSEKRAQAVMNALIAKGIDKSRLTSKGWGATKPIGDNSTDDGKAQNRRVEIVKQ